MRNLTKALTIAALSATLASPAVFSADNRKGMAGEAMDADLFVKMCDADKDGMVSKSEVMKRVEKMFDKADSKKAGRLDKKQVEFFLQELMKSGA